MKDVGYFENVSANLNTDVGSQVKDSLESVKANSVVGVSWPVNAFDTGLGGDYSLKNDWLISE